MSSSIALVSRWPIEIGARITNTVLTRDREGHDMRSIAFVRPSLSKARQTKRAGAAALAALALTGGLASGEAQAIPLEDDGSTGAVFRAPGGEIIGYDCTGRPITRFDTPPTWCPPSLPIGEEV